MIISKKCMDCGHVATQEFSVLACPSCNALYDKTKAGFRPLEKLPEQQSSPASKAAQPAQEKNMGYTPRTKSAEEKFCVECGSIIRMKAEICPSCGVRQPALEGIFSGIPNQRKCLSCGHTGVMKTWLSNYNKPQLIAFVGLLFWVLPGLAFIAWAWGKYKCPRCGNVGENIPA